MPQVAFLLRQIQKIQNMLRDPWRPVVSAKEAWAARMSHKLEGSKAGGGLGGAETGRKREDRAWGNAKSTRKDGTNHDHGAQAGLYR